MVWTILSVIVVVSLVVFFNSRNAVWGGATFGLIIGVIVAFVRDGFLLSTLWKGVVVGVIVGVVSEVVPRLAQRGRRS